VKVEAECSSETLATICQTERKYGRTETAVIKCRAISNLIDP